jgi:hypothetical protein
MQVNFAHLRDQGIDFAVFDADARTHARPDRVRLLMQLAAAVRSHGHKVDKAALAFAESGNVKFWVTKI